MKRYFPEKALNSSWRGIFLKKYSTFFMKTYFSRKSIKLSSRKSIPWKSIQLFHEKVLFLKKHYPLLTNRYFSWKSIKLFPLGCLLAPWPPNGSFRQHFFYWQKLEKSLVEMNQTIKTWLFKRVKIYMELFQGGNSKFFLYL